MLQGMNIYRVVGLLIASLSMGACGVTCLRAGYMPGMIVALVGYAIAGVVYNKADDSTATRDGKGGN